MIYLLSSGRTTTRLEYYVLDLFKIYLTVYPDDIPGAPSIGFDYIIQDTRKSDLVDAVRNKVSGLVSKISSRINDRAEITIDSIEILDETKARITVTINKLVTDSIDYNL